MSAIALLFVVFLGLSVGAALAAQRVGIPYPIAFVIGGIALAFVPHLPKPTMSPDLIFLIVLPPLLGAGGWTTDWIEFRRNIRPIGLLAVGLVIVSTAVVAVVAHALAGLSWPMAFVLGAVISPPDAVAAEAIFESMSVPRRVAAIITGEGLVNDGTALTLYRFALAAAVTGTFSLMTATFSFFLVAIGGVAIGLLVGFAISELLDRLKARGFDDAILSNIVIVLSPYIAYFAADSLGASGVLATVAGSIYLSRRSGSFFSSEGRVVAGGVWQIMVFGLNAVVFLLIGLQLPIIVSALASQLSRFALDALIVTVVAILVRVAWVFAAGGLQGRFFPLTPEDDDVPSWRSRAIVSWSGMRGIVSLASALALPYQNAAGAPLTGRSEIIFITLCVIVATLGFQGLTLAPLIRWLGVSETSPRSLEETQIRIQALKAGVRRLHALEKTFTSPAEWEVVGRLLGEYGARIEHLQGHLDHGEAGTGAESAIDHRLQEEALGAERREIGMLRRNGQIADDIYRAIEYDLDLADLRLR